MANHSAPVAKQLTTLRKRKVKVSEEPLDEHITPDTKQGRAYGWSVLLIINCLVLAWIYLCRAPGKADEVFTQGEVVLIPRSFITPEEVSTPLHEITFKSLRPCRSRRAVDSEPGRWHGPLPSLPDHIPLDLPLDRDFPDFRNERCKAQYFDASKFPSVSVVMIFSNEPIETLLRSVHSILNRTLPCFLEEIILVDDGSTHPDLGDLLADHVRKLPKTKLFRNDGKLGITRARYVGIEAAAAGVFVVLDSHIEVEEGWLEPMLHEIVEDPLAMVMPTIDSIDLPDGYKPLPHGIGCNIGLIWRLMDHGFTPKAEVSPQERLETLTNPTASSTSPIMAGGLFAARKDVFLSIGGYDFGMEGWGAENVELSLRLWQCGAKLKCSPCSRVAHIFNRGQFYDTNKLHRDYESNRLRTAAVWMDEFAPVVETFVGKSVGAVISDISSLTRSFLLRKNLQCKSFKWFLDEVYPESHVSNIDELSHIGPIYRMTDVTTQDLECLAIKFSKKTLQGNKVVVSGRTENCHPFLRWDKVKTITSTYDDESAIQASKLRLDWNRDWDPDLRIDMEILEEMRFIHDDYVRLFSIVRFRPEAKPELCLSNIDGDLKWDSACDDHRSEWFWQKDPHPLLSGTNYFSDFLNRNEF